MTVLTTLPFQSTLSVGMDLTSYSAAVRGLSSTCNWTIVILSLCSAASVGAAR
jgi:hypothetical protein